MINEICGLLTPHFSGQQQRQALVGSALFGCPVLAHIDWSGPSQVFCVNLAQTLMNFGECEPGKLALVAVLEAARDQTGKNKHPRYNDLIERVKQANVPGQAETGENQMDKMELIGFLITTGTWIQSYLSKKLELRRQAEPEKPPIDVADKQQMEADAPAELDAAGVDVNALGEILKLKHENIMRWQKDREKVDRLVGDGAIPPLTGENQKEALEKKIKDSLAEVPTILERAGMLINQT